MNNLLVILFAVLDSNAWSHRCVVRWSDQLILSSECPKNWLFDLSLSNSVEDALDVMRDVMKDSGVLLPANIGDLMVGLILLRFDKGEISEDETRTHLIDIIDSYGTTAVDVEAVAGLDFNNEAYSWFRANADEVLKNLTEIKLLDSARSMIED